MAGFDVSQFLMPFRGDPLGGQKMQLEAQLQGTRNVTHAAQVLQDSLQKRRQDALLREQLGLRAQQLESLDAARLASGQRATARLGFDREKFGFERQKYQGGTDADAVQALAGQLRRGDTNGLAAAAAAASAKDPSLTVRLPGQPMSSEVGTSTPEGMSFTLDEAYPEDLQKLRVQRDGRSLLEMDPAAAQQNEQDMYGAATAGLSRSPFAAMYAPAVESGIGGAGRGATGTERAEDAIKLATNERDALLRREGHEAMLGSRQAAQAATAQNREFQQKMAVDRRIEGTVKEYKPQIKELNDRSASLQNMLSMMESSSAWQQNSAFAENILLLTGKASTDNEMKRLQSRNGQWDRLEMMANGWLKNGEVPEELRKEFRESTEQLLRAAQARRNSMGLEAKDRIYAASELPFGDEERAVRAANQVWTGLGNPSLTPEEMAGEVARLRKARGMAGPSVSRETPMAPAGGMPMPDAGGEYVPSDPAVRDDPRLRGGGPGGLGTTGQRPGQVPMVPQQPASGSAEEDEARAFDRQLEEMLNAGP